MSYFNNNNNSSPYTFSSYLNEGTSYSNKNELIYRNNEEQTNSQLKEKIQEKIETASRYWRLFDEVDFIGNSFKEVGKGNFGIVKKAQFK